MGSRKEKGTAKVKSQNGEMEKKRKEIAELQEKIKAMIGRKLLTVEPLRVEPQARDRLVGRGRTFVCVDTVGAGDSLTAAVVLGMLQDLPLAKMHDWASRVAGYVCSKPGATPGGLPKS